MGNLKYFWKDFPPLLTWLTKHFFSSQTKHYITSPNQPYESVVTPVALWKYFFSVLLSRATSSRLGQKNVLVHVRNAAEFILVFTSYYYASEDTVAVPQSKLFPKGFSTMVKDEVLAFAGVTSFYAWDPSLMMTLSLCMVYASQMTGWKGHKNDLIYTWCVLSLSHTTILTIIWYHPIKYKTVSLSYTAIWCFVRSSYTSV